MSELLKPTETQKQELIPFGEPIVVTIHWKDRDNNWTPVEILSGYSVDLPDKTLQGFLPNPTSMKYQDKGRVHGTNNPSVLNEDPISLDGETFKLTYERAISHLGTSPDQREIPDEAY